jgi:lsr operon transcriptional repressor
VIGSPWFSGERVTVPTSRSRRGSGRDVDRELLVRAAWYYYRDDLTQAEIGERLHLSRPTVVRLLQRARSEGIVTIDVDTTGVGGVELAAALRERWTLSDTVIVPQLGRSVSGEVTNSRVARAGAQYLRRHLGPGKLIAIGWGDTVLRTLLELPTSSTEETTFIALTGGVDGYTAKVRGSAGATMPGHIRFVPSPLIASSPEVARMLRREGAVVRVLEEARTADATLIGIGGAVPNATILQSGDVSEAQIREYQRQGALGDILGQWYDEHGQSVAIDLDMLRIGTQIDELRRMKNVIGVAGGIDKAPAIRGALEGGYLDVLVTTEDVARDLLDA